MWAHHSEGMWQHVFIVETNDRVREGRAMTGVQLVLLFRILESEGPEKVLNVGFLELRGFLLGQTLNPQESRVAGSERALVEVIRVESREKLLDIPDTPLNRRRHTHTVRVHSITAF